LSEPSQEMISKKLRRLPGELLRALLNATAILVIIAAVLVLVAITRVNNFAGHLVETTTEAALSRIDLPSRDVLANIRTLTEEIRGLRSSLGQVREGDPKFQSDIAGLREALSTLDVNIERLTSARTLLTDEGIGHLSRSVSDTLTSLRGCASGTGTRRPGADNDGGERGELMQFSDKGHL